MSTPHPKLGNVPTQTVHRMHVPRKHCVYIYVYTGGAGTHARDTHGRTRAHGCTDHSITQTNLTTIPKPSQPTNATPTHPNALRPKPPTAASLFQGNRRVGAGSFVVPTSSRQAKVARKVTHPSAALREAAVLRHGKRRSLPCTACAPPQESVSPNSTV